jgi:hypothetical protein
MDILTSSMVAGLEFLKKIQIQEFEKLTDDTLWGNSIRFLGLSEQNLTYED